MTHVATTSAVKDSILDTIATRRWSGLSRIRGGPAPPAWSQARTFNPGGSIKDRVAVALIERPNATDG